MNLSRFMRLDPGAMYRRISELLESRSPFAVATITEIKGSCPQKPGARMIVFADGTTEFTIGGGTFEAEVTQDARALLEGKGGAGMHEYRLHKTELGMYCQGVVHVFLELYNPRPCLLILGGGHVGQALSRLAGSSGLFSVVVVDDRPEYAAREKHPLADRVIHTDREFVDAVPDVDAQTYMVIVTRCHTTDKTLVKRYLSHPLAYIGVIGSRSKALQFKRELNAEGMSEALLAKLHIPIGLPIGGKDPAEVAISILAELIQAKNAPAEAEPPQDDHAP